MKLHMVEQRTPEWHALRMGKMTASEAQCIAANGRGLESYIFKVVVAAVTGRSQENFDGNSHTDRGNELEAEARLSYELTKDVTVQEVGFIELDEYVGCSPDGLIGEDGGLEIKCPNDVKYFQLLTGSAGPEESYVWQCHMSLLITGRKYWDLAYYNPNFRKSLLVFRIEPELWRQEKLTLGIEKGKKLIQSLYKDYEQHS